MEKNINAQCAIYISIDIFTLQRIKQNVSFYGDIQDSNNEQRQQQQQQQRDRKRKMNGITTV